MTREEAIKRLKDGAPFSELLDVEWEKAINMAIKALEHPEQNVAAVVPCEDAVSRADTLQSFESYCDKNCQFSKKQRNVMCGACMMGDAIEIVESLPPVNPKPRTGKWMKTGQSFLNPSKFRNYCCSECGWELDEHIRVEPHYCPNCGAKMEGE